MRISFFFFVAVIIAAGCPLRSRAQEEARALSNGAGDALIFTPSEAGWSWSGLRMRGEAAAEWAVSEEPAEVSANDITVALAATWQLVEAADDRVVLQQDLPEAGVSLRRVFTFGTAKHVVRIETWMRSESGARRVGMLGLFAGQFVGEAFGETGLAPASFPVFGTRLFAGIEHVSGEASVSGESSDHVRLVQRPRTSIDETWQHIATAVVGWTVAGAAPGLNTAGRLRQAFLDYLDTVRIKPDRILLHTDTWWTVPLPLNEKNVLNDIEALRKSFMERTGMFFDTYCVDLGWSDPKTLWKMDTSRFPNELRAINERLGGLGAQMGLWLSPGSGYPDGLNNGWLQSQGYETLPWTGTLEQAACFALGGRYQREVKERLVAYARQYGLGHVILDYMAQRCDVASHGHPVGPESRYAIDAGLADVLDSLRAVNPQMALEPMVCGYPPSPWWLMKTPFVLGPAGDDLPYGRGPCPEWLESLITARDIAYRGGPEHWIMPTQALETFDIVVLTPGDFQNMAVMAIGRGRWFLSTYFKNDLMQPDDWDFLAALVRWARENKQYLGNAWQFGGNPENREAYGFMFRNTAKDLYCVRNPWIEPRTIELPVSGLAAEARDVRMIYPRRATVGRIEPGGAGPRLTLAPYETVFLETVPAGENSPAVAEAVSPVVEVRASEPRLLSRPVLPAAQDSNGIRYYWDGELSVPDVASAELCILIEGAAEANRAACKVLFGGREVQARKVTSAGQFGAAIEASPENWSWFIVPLARGDTSFVIDLNVLLEDPVIGVFVRGTAVAQNDPAPEEGAAFPTFQADRRGWSQTLQAARPVSEMPR